TTSLVSMPWPASEAVISPVSASVRVVSVPAAPTGKGTSREPRPSAVRLTAPASCTPPPETERLDVSVGRVLGPYGLSGANGREGEAIRPRQWASGHRRGLASA